MYLCVFVGTRVQETGGEWLPFSFVLVCVIVCVCVLDGVESQQSDSLVFKQMIAQDNSGMVFFPHCRKNHPFFLVCFTFIPVFRCVAMENGILMSFHETLLIHPALE